MKQTKDIILQKSFKLFLKDNYEKVTVTDLEEVTGMKRGVIFYHARNKLQLFTMVVDKYILSLHNPDTLPQFHPDISLLKYIGAYIEYLQNMIQTVSKESEDQYCLKSYFQFALQALKYYPHFSEKIEQIFSQEDAIWEKVIINARHTGEIRNIQNISETASLFRRMYFGLSFEKSFLDGLRLSQVHQNFLLIYNLLRNSHPKL